VTIRRLATLNERTQTGDDPIRASQATKALLVSIRFRQVPCLPSSDGSARVPARTIVDFQERFSNEAACLEYLAASRWPGGYRCPACGGEHAWVLERRHLWECARCHHQSSATAGTVMHGTRTPLRLWFWSAYLVATHTPGISAKQLQCQLGVGRYETAWLILQKLRRAMINPEREPLRGEVEIDESDVGGRHSSRRGGREREGKTLVGVASRFAERARGACA
jgi:hypothetical protein